MRRELPSIRTVANEDGGTDVANKVSRVADSFADTRPIQIPTEPNLLDNHATDGETKLGPELLPRPDTRPSEADLFATIDTDLNLAEERKRDASAGGAIEKMILGGSPSDEQPASKQPANAAFARPPKAIAPEALPPKALSHKAIALEIAPPVEPQDNDLATELAEQLDATLLPPNNSVDAIRSDTSTSNVAKADRRELLLQAARNAYRLKDYATAIARFTEHLRRYPDDGEARLEFAGLLSEQGNVELAGNQMEHLLQQFPDNYVYLRSYVDLQLQVGNYANAEPALRLLLQQPPHRLDAAIDLARLLAWTNRTQEAHEIYQFHLQTANPDDTDQQMRFAELLNEIDQTARALELLLGLHRQHPLNPKVLRLIILASARSGDFAGAIQFIQQLQTIRPEDLAIRDSLARQLHDEGFQRLSMQVDQQILSFDARHKRALLRTARSNLQLYEPVAAKSVLAPLDGADDAEANVVLAEYRAAIGEWADAIAIYRRLLARNPLDAHTRIGLGHAYVQSGQFRRAVLEFSRIQDGVAVDARQHYVEAQLAAARALAHADDFAAAYATVDALGASPQSFTFRDLILDTFIDVANSSRQYASTATAIRNGLPGVLGRPYRESQLRAKLGLALIRGGDHAAGLQEFRVIGHMDSPHPEVAYGTYLAHTAMGNPQLAKDQLNQFFGTLAADTYLRVRVAELAMEDCDCCLAREVLQHLGRFCESNPIVANRLGAACLQCATCENTTDCGPYFQTVLQQSPMNVQALLGLARTMSRAAQFEEANHYYQRAIRVMPDNTNVTREAARIMHQSLGPSAAAPIYNQALQQSSGEHLYQMAQSSPERSLELEQEFESLGYENSLLATEMSGKQHSGWKPLSAINDFEGLSALEPNNEDAVFEIGQAYSQMNRTHEAIARYERLLCINPCNVDAVTAIERNRLEMSPQLQLFSTWSSQRGFDDLTVIDSLRTGAYVRFPVGEEDEFLQIGYTRGLYQPDGGPQLDENTASVRFQVKHDWATLFWAEAEFQTYNYGFQDRVNFDIGIRHAYLENASLQLAGLRENVLQNGESAMQDIHRVGFEISHNWRPTRRMQFDSRYRYWDYSDDNIGHEASINSGLTLREGPQQLRWLFDVDIMAFREQSTLPNAPGLTDATHPYFAPDTFVFATTGLEWRNHLGCQSFKGANLHWYELFLGARMDNDGEGYGVARGQWVRDIRNWLSLRIHGQLVRSSFYDLTEAGANLTIRF